MSSKETIVFYLSFLTIIVFGVVGVLCNNSTDAKQAAQKVLVMNICLQAKQTADAASEHACADAQNTYKVEFLCSSQTQEAACWTE